MTGRIQTARFCIACNGELSRKEQVHNGGRCPLCGYKGPYASTIVEVNERPYRMVLKWKPPWWKFWRSVVYERQWTGPLEINESALKEKVLHEASAAFRAQRVAEWTKR